MSSFKIFTTVTCRCGKEMESREIFEDGEWRCACGESVNIPTHTTLQNERDTLRDRLNALTGEALVAVNERDEAIGIDPGWNDGPYKNCRDCGRRMVWSDPGSECPAWMCPRCVRERMMQAEKEREGSMSLIDKLQVEISDLSDQAGEMQKQVNDAECKKIDARQMCERWKQAVREYHLHVIKNYNAGISLDASEAMRDGNLEALEAALKIHGGKKE